MSYRRESYSVLRIGSILSATIKVDRQPLLFLDQQIPVKFNKCYGIITDKTLDDQINVSTGITDYLFKIDDGTGSIWIRSSSRTAETLQKWDFIRVIGYLSLDTSNGKDYEVTIYGEGIAKVEDKEWELVHILESLRSRSTKKKSPGIGTRTEPNEQDHSNEEDSVDQAFEDEENSDESSTTDSLTQKIERILRENDSGNGVEFSVILKLSGVTDESEVDDILFELAYEGKVYQPRPDFYKIME